MKHIRTIKKRDISKIYHCSVDDLMEKSDYWTFQFYKYYNKYHVMIVRDSPRLKPEKYSYLIAKYFGVG